MGPGCPFAAPFINLSFAHTSTSPHLSWDPNQKIMKDCIINVCGLSPPSHCQNCSADERATRDEEVEHDNSFYHFYFLARLRRRVRKERINYELAGDGSAARFGLSNQLSANRNVFSRCVIIGSREAFRIFEATQAHRAWLEALNKRKMVIALDGAELITACGWRRPSQKFFVGASSLAGATVALQFLVFGRWRLRLWTQSDNLLAERRIYGH